MFTPNDMLGNICLPVEEGAGRPAIRAHRSPAEWGRSCGVRLIMQLKQVQIRSILTRTSGFLRTVSSHSLQPYCGCALGRSLCGVGCYVRHNGHLTRGRNWGEFVEVRTNAAEAYVEQFERERAWARREGGRFGTFLSSSTEPFQPTVHWVFTEDLDACYLELKSLGAKIVALPEIKPWGLRQFTVADLDGNLFHFHA